MEKLHKSIPPYSIILKILERKLLEKQRVVKWTKKEKKKEMD